MPVRNSMDRRVVAWAEVSIVFLALYLGVPLAGLTIDRGLGLPTIPVAVRFAGLPFLLVGLAGLAWGFSPFPGAQGPPHPPPPPRPLATPGPYPRTRKPHAGGPLPPPLGGA